jgi:probable rRNA maturation factor
MNNLTVEIEQEDLTADAQHVYQLVPTPQMEFTLQSTVTQLIAMLSLDVSIDGAEAPTLGWPEFAKEVLSLFSSFYVFIVFVDSPKSQALNQAYRQKNNPTNILSFPSAIPLDFYRSLPKNEQEFMLGDLVVDLSVIQTEAKAQNKKVTHHLFHILIHGLLHLLSFDHIVTNEAIIMEKLEIQLLHHLGIPNPYDSDIC